MYVNAILDSRNNRRILVFQEKYRDEKGKQRTRLVERIGYLDELEKLYDDPKAHFKAIAKERTLARKSEEGESIISFEVNKEGLMRFNDEGEYDIRLPLGDVPVAAMIHELALDRFIDVRRKNLKIEYNLTNLFRLLVYSRILIPASKRSDWHGRDRHYEKMDFNLNQVYSGLQQLAKWKEPMLDHLNAVAKEKFGRQSGFGFFDGTNVYYEIEDEDGFRMRGCSKEHRPLPITQLGVLLDSNGIPMSYDIYKGNTNDSEMLHPAMDRVRDRFGLKHMIYVADKGFYAGNSIAQIITEHNGYVISNSVRGTKIDKDMRRDVLDLDGYSFFDDSGRRRTSFDGETCFMYKTMNVPGHLNVTDDGGTRRTVKETGRFVIAFWSRKYSERAKQDRCAAIEKAAAMSHGRTRSKIDNQHGANRYLRTEVLDKDGNSVDGYSAQVKFDNEAVMNDEKLDGFYLIETNLAGRGWFGDTVPFEDGQDVRWRSDWGMLQLNRNLSVHDIIDFYRNLWMIEDSFKVMKSFFRLRPVHVSCRQSIEGHFLICFISLLIVRLLQWKCDGEFTANRLLSSLRKAEIAEVVPGKYINLYYDRVLMRLCSTMKLNLNQKAYTQMDLRNLFASTRKVRDT